MTKRGVSAVIAYKIGGRLRAVRQARELTLEEVAKGVNVSYVAIQKWELSKVIPNVDRVEALASALVVSTEFLLRGVSVSPSPPSTALM